MWPESDKSVCVCMRVPVCYISACSCTGWEKPDMPVCHENQDYLNLVDVVRLYISCTIKETGFFIALMVTKAHEYMPKHTHAHIRLTRTTHTHNNHTRRTHKCAHALKPKWGIYVHYPLSSLHNLSQAGWSWSVKKISSRPAEST